MQFFTLEKFTVNRFTLVPMTMKIVGQSLSYTFSITSAKIATAIDENSGAGQSIYTTTSNDEEATFSLKGTGDDALFSIDTSTGVVTLTADPDYETKSSYSFTVVATNTDSDTTEQTVTLAINDLNDTAIINTVAITSSSGAENSTLNVDDTVTATVTFGEAVTVTGTPQLALNIGGTTGQADYDGGTGTASLTFSYTVQAGENDANGISIDANSLSLNSGTIKDASTVDATLTHDAVSDNVSYLVDTTTTTVTSVSVPSDGTYDLGYTMDFTINFSENITLTGTSSTLGLTLSTGGAVTAGYLSTTADSITYRYTVQSGDLDIVDGVVVGTITLNGDTIQDAAGNNATLTLNNVGDTSGVLADGVGPLVTLSIDNSAPTEAGTDTVTITATAAETYTSDITVNLAYSGTADGGGVDYSDGSASITITAGQLTGTTSVTIVDDTSIDDDETIIISISSVTNGTEDGTQEVTATVVNDDTDYWLTVNVEDDTATDISYSFVPSFTSGRPNYAGTYYLDDEAVIGPNGVLYYGSYTQLINKSEDISDTVWIENEVTFSAANIMMETASASFHGVRQVLSGLGDNVTIIMSAKLKSIGREWARLTIKKKDSVFVRAWYNISSGTVGTVETGGIATIEDAGDGYFICTLLVNILSGETPPEAHALCARMDNETAYAGDVTKGLYATDIQVTDTLVKMPYVQNTTTGTITVPVNNGSSTTGNSLAIDGDLLNITDGKADGTILNSGDLVAANTYLVITTETDTFGSGVVAGDRVTGLTTTLDANNTVQTILDAQGNFQFDWTPSFNSIEVVTQGNIISVDGSTPGMLSYTATGIELSDGTNTASVTIAYVKGTTYRTEPQWGTHPTEGVNKMQLVVRNSAGIVIEASSITTFAGTFSPDDSLVPAYNAALPQEQKNISFGQTPEWETPT